MSDETEIVGKSIYRMRGFMINGGSAFPDVAIKIVEALNNLILEIHDVFLIEEGEKVDSAFKAIVTLNKAHFVLINKMRRNAIYVLYPTYLKINDSEMTLLLLTYGTNMMVIDGMNAIHTDNTEFQDDRFRRMGEAPMLHDKEYVLVPK